MPSLRHAAWLASLFVARVAGADPLLADDPAQPHYSLSRALEEARQHEPRLRAALAELKARKAEQGVPRAEWLPRVGATAQIFGATNNATTGVYVGVPEVDIPRTGSTGGATQATATWRPDVSTLAALSVTQEVYDFGRISAQIAVSDAAARGASADAEVAMLEVLSHADESFHSVLAAHEVLRATEDAYHRAETHRDYAQATTKSGLRPPIDLTRAQADVSRLQVQRVRAFASLRVARANLAAAIGANVPEVEAIEPEQESNTSPTLDDALRLAASRNPAIRSATAALDAQKATTREITREMLPNLFATGGLSGRAGGTAASGPPAAFRDDNPEPSTRPYGGGWLPDVVNWHVGLVFSWNVFDGTVLARRRAAKAREEKANAQLDLAKLATMTGTERAWVELDAAQKVLPELQQSLKAAQANQQQADMRFRSGLGTVVELADAEALLTNAQVDLGVGDFNVARARAQLVRAIGDASQLRGLTK